VEALKKARELEGHEETEFQTPEFDMWVDPEVNAEVPEDSSSEESPKKVIVFLGTVSPKVKPMVEKWIEETAEKGVFDKKELESFN
jgi:hypothetical protein